MPRRPQPEPSPPPVLSAQPSNVSVQEQLASTESSPLSPPPTSSSPATDDRQPPLAAQTPPIATVSTSSSSKRLVRIAIQGCCHGELDRIYASCQEHERTTGHKLDLLLCCGDFQSTRDQNDLHSMAVPEKYKTLGDFPKYVDGTFRAPILTIFIGGNHEASNVLAEQYYGGYVAPNIYYLGHSAVIEVLGLKIAGLSGIFKGRDFTLPYPRVPYDQYTVKSAYHVRSFEIEKLERYGEVLAQLRDASSSSASPSSSSPSVPPRPVDIVLSHDWPVGITKYGNEKQLLEIKPYFEEDIRHGVLGNPHTLGLLRLLKPVHWFAAHLHCFFTATVTHLRSNSNSSSSTAGGSHNNNKVPWNPRAMLDGAPTQFIALDKCVHQQHKFLHFLSLEVPHDSSSSSAPPSPAVITMDPLWAEIVRRSHHLLRVGGTERWERTVRGATSPVDPLSVSSLVEWWWGNQSSLSQQNREIVPTMTSTAALLRSLQILSPSPFFAVAAVSRGGGVGRSTHGALPPPQRPPPMIVPAAKCSKPSSVTAPAEGNVAEASPVAQDDDACLWVEDVGS